MKKFSWKRATGLSNAKRKFNKATGITRMRNAKFAVEHPADAALNSVTKAAKRSMRRTGKQGKGCGCPCSMVLLAMVVLPIVGVVVLFAR